MMKILQLEMDETASDKQNLDGSDQHLIQVYETSSEATIEQTLLKPEMMVTQIMEMDVTITVQWSLYGSALETHLFETSSEEMECMILESNEMMGAELVEMAEALLVGLRTNGNEVQLFHQHEVFYEVMEQCYQLKSEMI